MKFNFKLLALWLAFVGAQTWNGIAATTNETATTPEQTANSHQVGEFHREGEYVKGNSFLKEGDTYHRFIMLAKLGRNRPSISLLPCSPQLLPAGA